jgi:uncharacterized protein with NRDE domain
VATPVGLGPGIYGVSNHLLDTPWPKVERTKNAFRQWCAAEAVDLGALFALLHDTERAPDEMLPATGVTLERERMLSSPFIVSPDYGTRCSTVVTVEDDGTARFIERTSSDGKAIGEIDVRFASEGRSRFLARAETVVREDELRPAVAHQARNGPDR